MDRIDVKVYTDGASSHNGYDDAVGGWGAILTYGTTEKVIRGYEAGATNNMMELRAVIEAIRVLKAPCNVTVVTDSQYVCNGVEGIVKRSSFTLASGKPMSNIDMWKELVSVGKAGNHKIHFEKIKGHAGHTYNVRCDTIAREQCQKGREVA